MVDLMKWLATSALWLALAVPVAAQTFVGPLPAGNVVGNPTGATAPPTAFPIFSTANAWTAAQSVSIPGVFTNAAANLNGQFLVNGLNPATQYSTWQGGNHQTEALTAGVLVPVGSTVFGANAIGAYIQSNVAPVGIGGHVAGYFQAIANVNSANMFGINPVVADNVGFTGIHLQNEFDFNVNNAATTVTGIAVVLSGTVTPTVGVAIAVEQVGGRIWGSAFFSQDAAAFLGLQLGTSAAGNNVASQAISLRGIDGGGIIRAGSIFASSAGDLILRSGQNTNSVVLQDFNGGAGTNLFYASTTGINFFFPMKINGSSSGVITIQPQAAAGTFNWNWPTTAGAAGNVLASGGGGAAPMTWITGVTTVCTVTAGNSYTFTNGVLTTKGANCT